MEPLPYLERVKIQSEILLPLYRRLRDELGAERAAELLRASVREYASALGKAVRESEQGTSLDKLRSLMPAFAASGALEVEPLADNPREFLLNVRRCGYAEYFRSLGESEFGAMLTCEIDPPITEAIGDDLSLKRTQTIMSGGDHCDFRWRLGN
ncbi:MAG: L-2-amino-thiazoline-4-carboxylic acid hydrolase [Proteobacteria bacterium]|nr:L-2-amino-thiazoline-4-carboxylic acid hydrolase [Pseudomonadota bacterium]